MSEGKSIKERIDSLEEEKKGLIEKVKALSKELKLKKIEYNVVKKLAEEAKKMNAGKIIRQLKALEFKVSTQALTPAVERKYVKKIVELERKLKKLKPYLNAEKRLKYLEESISKLEGEIEEIEGKLKEMRKELKDLYRKYKLIKKAKRSNISYSESKDEEMFTLEDVVEIEEK